jgi:hypothetical protein
MSAKGTGDAFCNETVRADCTSPLRDMRKHVGKVQPKRLVYLMDCVLCNYPVVYYILSFPLGGVVLTSCSEGRYCSFISCT